MEEPLPGHFIVREKLAPRKYVVSLVTDDLQLAHFLLVRHDEGTWIVGGVPAPATLLSLPEVVCWCADTTVLGGTPLQLPPGLRNAAAAAACSRRTSPAALFDAPTPWD